MQRLKILLLVLISQSSTFAQDSLNNLLLDEYLDIIIQTHPVARNADLEVEMRGAELLKTKGNFDPKVGLDIDQKYFDDKEYFDNSIAQIKIPIWYGPEIKAGYELNEGDFLNPQNNVPGDGLAFVGLSLPLGRGLFYDSRRFEQQQAEIFNEAAKFQKNMILADLFYRARSRYFEWQGSYRIIQTLNQITELAFDRFEFVKSAYTLGDMSAIDTLESYNQYRNRVIDLGKETAKYTNNIAKLSALISFDEEFNNLLSNIAPDLDANIIDTLDLISIIENIEEINPELALLKAELESVELSNKLARENLKPDLDVSYNLLNNGNNYNEFDTFNEANYKWNLSFNFPLLLRKERGELQKTSIKIELLKNKYADKKAEISFKLNGLLDQISQLIPVVEGFTSLRDNYRTLLDAENLRFQLGDSELLKVNIRENKLIEIEIKRIEEQIKLNILQAEFYKIAGVAL